MKSAHYPLERRTVVIIEDDEVYQLGGSAKDLRQGLIPPAVSRAMAKLAVEGIAKTQVQEMRARKRANYLRRYPWLRLA